MFCVIEVYWMRGPRDKYSVWQQKNAVLSAGTRPRGVLVSADRTHAVFVHGDMMFDFNDCVGWAPAPPDGFHVKKYNRYKRPLMTRINQLSVDPKGNCFLFSYLCSRIVKRYGIDELLAVLLEPSSTEFTLYERYRSLL